MKTGWEKEEFWKVDSENENVWNFNKAPSEDQLIKWWFSNKYEIMQNKLTKKKHFILSIKKRLSLLNMWDKLGQTEIFSLTQKKTNRIKWNHKQTVHILWFLISLWVFDFSLSFSWENFTKEKTEQSSKTLK